MEHRDFSGYHLSETPVMLTSIPGERSKQLLALQQKLEGNVVSYPRKMPIAIKRAKGATIEDVDGNLLLDFFAMAGVLNVGHCNEDVLAYVTEQQKNLVHSLDFPTENKISAMQKIMDNLPEGLRDQYKISFGGPTGSDAVEAAIKLAKIKTGRDTIIAFAGSYHGMTSAALSATSDVTFRNKLSSLVPNIHFVPYSYCYRCPFGEQHTSCGLKCASYLRNVLENPHSGIPKPAAIIMEPIQGEGGSIVPRDGYLKEIVNICHDNDVLVIFDEIQSGFFRSGSFMSWMDADAVPDIITISKGIGGVGFPLSAILYKKEVEAWWPGAHVGTFRSNQVSLAAANGALDFAKNNRLGEHTERMGAYLMQGLQELKAICPYIGEVRGKGLMIGIEFVKDRDTKEPFAEFVTAVRKRCLQMGLLFEVGGHYGNVIRLLPPLIITKKIIDSALDILQDATLAELEERAATYAAATAF
jgi:diaminobutyrate-2-oxoglutarate transaminase